MLLGCFLFFGVVGGILSEELPLDGRWDRRGRSISDVYPISASIDASTLTIQSTDRFSDIPDPGGPLFGANTAILDVAFYYPGSYQVVVRAQNAAGMGEYRTSGCNVYSASRSLVVYPNPVANTLNIKFDEGENSVNSANGQKQYDIKLYNIHGSLKLSTKSSGEQVSLDVSALSEGNYILQISDGVEISVEQIIIRR